MSLPNEKLRFVVAIPARYAATRLPGKPLLAIAGEPMVLHVARRALAAGAAEVVVATDDARIADALRAAPVRVVMTRADHASGSDRLAECAERLRWSDDAIVVNLQGDEPLAPPAGVRAVAECLVASDAPMATLATAITSAKELFDPNCVKVVTRLDGHALYFSRAPLPWARDAFARTRDALPGAPNFLRHIGIYAYRAGFLRAFTRLAPTSAERAESLEQLRALEHGYGIAVRLTPEPFPGGVDTPEDLARVDAVLRLAHNAR
ncbi:MAG: 3-deoxy-manno-octulosonate cytidylyltransferase [Xanthomonadaceae bacterium]|nr:3-deoxy-manno-octulosonate cytidylyltransferase [Xanthomonadaceae bacterium]MDE2083732.1 3-deoxy-manno-octulosonate cytidylyltransferase [Xanthomonadaceae bacterium]MDE2256230.1 3-deoxy-manno-octulosonate cytidylyltransferase [Xanthomonadaceae bacterium]